MALLSDKDNRPKCKCGRNASKRGEYKGKPYFRKKCNTCRGGYRSYRLNKGDKCERCGFEPEHMCQLDVDHIDGDKRNNDVSNLQTLCANCHRLKTIEKSDNLNKY